MTSAFPSLAAQDAMVESVRSGEYRFYGHYWLKVALFLERRNVVSIHYNHDDNDSFDVTLLVR